MTQFFLDVINCFFFSLFYLIENHLILDIFHKHFIHQYLIDCIYYAQSGNCRDRESHRHQQFPFNIYKLYPTTKTTLKRLFVMTLSILFFNSK